MSATTTPRCSNCGWTGTPTSPARAAYSVRQHRCAKHLAAQAARARGAAARAAIDRTPKPCLHKRANHQHGTNACYHLDNCRCTPCSRAAVAYDRQRSRNTAYGRWQPYTDAQPVRDHVNALKTAGMGLKTIAKNSGVAHGALWKLMYGRTRPDGTRQPSKQVKTETAQKLLALAANLDTLSPVAYVDATGTHRRIQALMAAGWSLSRQAQHLGVSPTNFPTVRQRKQVYARTAIAVRAMYDQLALQPPPETNQRERIAASRARNYAAARGWEPPAWWEPDWLDDPTFDPQQPSAGDHDGDDVDEVAIARAIDGDRTVTLSASERRLAVQQLHRRNLSDRQIARQLDIPHRSVLRIRQELDLPAVQRGAA